MKLSNRYFFYWHNRGFIHALDASAGNVWQWLQNTSIYVSSCWYKARKIVKLLKGVTGGTIFPKCQRINVTPVRWLCLNLVFCGPSLDNVCGVLTNTNEVNLFIFFNTWFSINEIFLTEINSTLKRRIYIIFLLTCQFLGA